MPIKSYMDIATIIGLISGTCLVFLAIFMGGQSSIFVNVPGLLIVVGGTLATCFIKFSMKDVINSVSVVMKAFTVKIQPPEEIMEKMVSLGKIAKESGLIALENEKPDDEFSAKALEKLNSTNKYKVIINTMYFMTFFQFIKNIMTKY